MYGWLVLACSKAAWVEGMYAETNLIGLCAHVRYSDETKQQLQVQNFSGPTAVTYHLPVKLPLFILQHLEGILSWE